MFAINIPIPPDYPVTAIKNCAQLAPSAANTFPFNDTSCAVADIAGPDLAPFGGTTCRRGESCTLDVRVDNKGKLPFVGSAGLHGTLSPAVTIASITSATSGFTCSVTGSGAYECKGAQLDIKPGGAVRLQLSIDIPADFPHDKITHVKEMVWPDRKVKDKNPANDRHESTITIVGPEVTPPPPPICAAGWSEVDPSKAKALRAQGWEITEVTSAGQSILCAKAPPPPQCLGGEIVRGQCECPKGTERRRIGDNAFRCVEIVPLPQCDKGWLEVSHDRSLVLGREGWVIKEVTSGGKSILCAKAPPPPQCDKGWLEVSRDRAKVLRAQGWEIDEVTRGGESVLCAKQPSLTCTGGRVDDGQCICPTGTERKQTATNAFACVKTAPPPQCDKGWLRSAKRGPKAGARLGDRRVTSGGKSILCAKRHRHVLGRPRGRRSVHLPEGDRAQAGWDQCLPLREERDAAAMRQGLARG
jgi:hypothetical protein